MRQWKAWMRQVLVDAHAIESRAGTSPVVVGIEALVCFPCHYGWTIRSCTERKAPWKDIHAALRPFAKFLKMITEYAKVAIRSIIAKTAVTIGQIASIVQ